MHINLLPWRENIQTQKIKNIYRRIMFYNIAFSLTMIFLHNHIDSKIKKINIEMIHMRNQIQKMELNNTFEKNMRLLNKLNSIYKKKKVTNQKNIQYYNLLSNIVTYLPGDVVFDTLNMHRQKTILTGISSNLNEIQIYNSKLIEQKLYKNVEITKINKDSNQSTVHFTMVISL